MIGKVWSRLFTAARGAVNETAEAVADSQAFRILDQEIREAEQGIVIARQSVAEMMGKRRVSEGKVASLRDKIAKDIESGRAAIEKGRHDLAGELAQRALGVKAELDAEEKALAEYHAAEQKLHQVVRDTDARIRALKQQVETVKVTESVQRAQASLATRSSGIDSRVGSALDSLERIRTRQETRSAQLEAASELDAITDGTDLDRRLRESGVTGVGGATVDDMIALMQSPQPALPAGEKSLLLEDK